MIRIGLFSIKFIKLGEQLTFDYRWKRNGDLSCTKCFCGAAKCRGFLEVIETPSTESAQTTNTAVKLSEQKVTGTIVKTAVIAKIGSEHHPDDSESSAVESIRSDKGFITFPGPRRTVDLPLQIFDTRGYMVSLPSSLESGN